MAHADFKGTPTYFAVFNMMISSINVNQNMLKISYFFKYVKIRQTLEIPLPDPSWLSAAGRYAPRSSPPCDLIHTYCTATKRYKFVALFNEGFKGKNFSEDLFLENTLYIRKYFVLNIREDSPKLFCFHTSMIQPHPLGASLVGFVRN